jgi:hypothetical protein
MRKLEGRFIGPLRLQEDTSVHGKVEGDLMVAPQVVCLMHGMVAGNLDVGRGARVELRGVVAGSARNRGRLVVYGAVRGFIHDEDGGYTQMIGPGDGPSDTPQR